MSPFPSSLPRAVALLLLLVVAPRMVEAQRLFRSDTALTITISTNLKAFIAERDSLKLAKFPGVLSYTDSGGAVKRLPVSLRARGHFRRQARNCQFPPVLLDFKGDSVKGSLLSGLKKLKITTNCKPGNAEYEQYILQEYALYRAYAAVSDMHLRTRLAHITYRDTLGKTAPITVWAFFTEDIEDLAQRTKHKVIESKGALFADLEQEQLARVSMFEYFVGNTDWSIAGQHNIALMADSTALNILPVAYDFDWSGAVDPRYAFPDPRLPIKRVSDRLYRGVCMSPTQFTSTLDLFKARRAQIDGVLTQVPPLAPDRAKSMKSFFDDFWKRTADPRGLQKEFANDCQKQGN